MSFRKQDGARAWYILCAANDLSIQVLKLNSKVDRFAWILENVPKFDGSGIIYCLTHSDCDEIADFLNENGISARSYYSGIDSDEAGEDPNIETECLFMENKIKVIVATIKLGMGYDKGDIAFVIHYQTPSSIVAYYQQIGRAGRKIDHAHTFLMNGSEDEDIHEYFRMTAFPTENEVRSVYNYIKDNSGTTITILTCKLNIPKTRIENALKFLLYEKFIYREYKNKVYKYYPSTKAFFYNGQHYKDIIKQREAEYDQMKELMDTDKCYNRFIVDALDDKTEDDCGFCANCMKRGSTAVSDKAVEKAASFVEKEYYEIAPRKKLAATSMTASSAIDIPNEVGICLSRYGHPVYGELVKKGKYESKRFDDRLVEKSAEVLTPFIAKNEITALTYVPSLRSDIVKDFAERLAQKLGLQCLTLFKKTSAKQQKEMENSSFQCENALNSFDILDGAVSPKSILLVDDMVDSKWTLTVCGKILTEAGAAHVYPFALASTSKRDE